MRRQDRELLADLAGVNTALPAFAQRVLGNYATPAEHDAVADRLIRLGQAIRRRAGGLSVISPEPDDDDAIDKNVAPRVGRYVSNASSWTISPSNWPAPGPTAGTIRCSCTTRGMLWFCHTANPVSLWFHVLNGLSDSAIDFAAVQTWLADCHAAESQAVPVTPD